MAVSSGGRVASVNVVTDSRFQVAIDDGAGGQKTMDFDGFAPHARLTWSADGTTLLLEYQGPVGSNPPWYVVLIKP